MGHLSRRVTEGQRENSVRLRQRQEASCSSHGLMHSPSRGNQGNYGNGLSKIRGANLSVIGYWQ